MARQPREKSEFEQKTLEVRRVTRVVEGGKRFSFRVLVAVGDGKGRVGVGVGKGVDVATAVEKGAFRARKNLIHLSFTPKASIPHEVRAKFGSAKVLMKPAAEGRGIVAGGTVRVICALAGIGNITAKLLGSSNKINTARAAILALKQLRPPKVLNKESESKKQE